MNLKKILIFEKVKVLNPNIYDFNKVSNYFRITHNATIPVNNQTNQSLIQTIALGASGFNQRTCMKTCNLNSNCGVFVVDTSQLICWLYSSIAFGSLSNSSNQQTTVYDKFVVLKDPTTYF